MCQINQNRNFEEKIVEMKGHLFNIDNGYLEALCRGFKNGILRQNDYLNLVQCETLDGNIINIWQWEDLWSPFKIGNRRRFFLFPSIFFRETNIGARLILGTGPAHTKFFFS